MASAKRISVEVDGKTIHQTREQWARHFGKEPSYFDNYKYPVYAIRKRLHKQRTSTALYKAMQWFLYKMPTPGVV